MPSSLPTMVPSPPTLASPVGQPAGPTARRTAARWMQLEITPRKVKPTELMNFSRQAAAFLRAGIPILDALALLSEETKNKLLRSILADTATSLRNGSSFSDGLARRADAFPPYFLAMVRSAELTGQLDAVLDQLAIYIERDLEARRKVKSALTYPSVVAFLAVCSVVVLAGYVLPRFKTFFGSLGARLPLPTRMLLATTNLITTIWPLLVAAAVGLLVGVVAMIRTEAGRRFRDRMLLRLPALRHVVRYAIVERFCRVLAALIAAGVPIPDALAVAADGTGNRVFQRALGKAREAMIRGEGLARPLAAIDLFPAGAHQMIRVGEATGTLDDQLLFAAGYYERELNYRLKRLTDLFEPAIIVFMGLVVGFVAVALVSAMYGIFNQVSLS